MVGLYVGSNVGFNVGDIDGALLGALLGDLEGDADGSSVGGKVTGIAADAVGPEVRAGVGAGGTTTMEVGATVGLGVTDVVGTLIFIPKLTSFSSSPSSTINSKHTLCPVSGSTALSTSGYNNTPFSSVLPFHTSVNI